MNKKYLSATFIALAFAASSHCASWEFSKELEDRSTLLHHAARDGQADAVQKLVEDGADVNAQDIAKRTPLYDASKGGHVEVVQLLLNAGTCVNVQEAADENSPLHIATERRHIRVVRALLDAGADIDMQDTNDGSCLLFAARNARRAIQLRNRHKGRKGEQRWFAFNEMAKNSPVLLLLERFAHIDEETVVLLNEYVPGWRDIRKNALNAIRNSFSEHAPLYPVLVNFILDKMIGIEPPVAT